MSTVEKQQKRDTPASRFPTAGFRRGMETADMDLAMENWTEDCVIRPLAPKGLLTILKGKPMVTHQVYAVTASCDEFVYTDEIVTDNLIILPFTATVRGMQVEAVDFLRINEEGKCEEMWVVGRPYFATNMLVGRAARKLAHPGGLWREALVWVLVRMLEVVQYPLHPVLIRRMKKSLEQSLAKGRAG
jgi:hypothetical protein